MLFISLPQENNEETLTAVTEEEATETLYEVYIF